MAEQQDLQTVLLRLKAKNEWRRQLSIRQLAAISGLRPRTIAHWFEGPVKKPHRWQALIRLAVALELDYQELDELLAAAGRIDLATLRAQVQASKDASLLAPWPSLDPPFQAENALEYFTDREDSLADLAFALTRPLPPPIVTITGMTGVGKTEIATQLAHTLREHFADGVLWVDAENANPLTKLGDLAADLRVDLSRYRELPERSRAFKEILKDRQVLIILDGVTKDQEVEPFVPPSNSRSSIVVTSQKHDLWSTRQAYVVNIDDFTDDDSLELYKKVLGRNRVASEPGDFSVLANSVGNLPIALDITAHLLKKNHRWVVNDLLTRIQGPEDRIEQLRMGTDQSIRNLFEASYAQLTRSQQAFFATLGVFAAGDFSSEATAFINQLPLARAEDMLISLSDLSLLKESANGRFRLHALLRDFAQLKQPVQGAEERMVLYYTNFAWEHRRDYVALAEELSNIRVALDAAKRRGMDRQFVFGVNGIYKHLEAQGLLAEAQERLDEALEASQQLPDVSAQARTLLHLADLARLGGEFTQAQARLEAALPLAHEGQDVETVCGALQGMGVIHFFQNDASTAESEFRQALSIAREASYEWGVCALLVNLSSLKLYQRKLDGVSNLLEEGLVLARALGVEEFEARLLSNFASMEDRLGNVDAANNYLEQSLELARRSNHLATIINISANLAATEIELEKYGAAAAHLLEALIQARKLGDAEALARVLRNYGELYNALGNDTASDEHFGEALEIVRSARHDVLTLTTLADWGELLLARGDRARAESFFDEIIDTASAADFPEFVAMAKHGQAQIRFDEGLLKEACRLAKEALALFEEMGDPRATNVSTLLAKWGCPDS